MARRFAFHQLDVFSDAPLLGNPVAVVHAAGDLDDGEMAALARWTNLSETTFLLPPTDPGADYRLRIFTPSEELPFAGHPTLGSCQAWLADGGVPNTPGAVIQQCEAGLIRIRQAGDRLAFAAPPLRRTGPLDQALLARLCAGAGLPPDAVVEHQWVDNGPGWCGLLLDSAERVLSARPDYAVLGDLKLGLIGPQAAGADTAFEVRAFVGSLAEEDPVTGSLNASLAVWMIGAGLAPDHYVAAQGTARRRAGRVFVDREGADIWVGGHAVLRVEGSLAL
jgi:PhzF family phenazine biosynthesis protein